MRVKIHRDSGYYQEGDVSNPIDIEGVLIEVEEDYFRVKWSDNSTGGYWEGDLETISGEENINIFN